MGRSGGFAAIRSPWLHSLVLRLEVHGEESKRVEPVLDFHAVGEPRAGPVFLLAHHTALAVEADELRLRGVLQFALIVLAVVLRVRLVVVVFVVLVLDVLAVVV